MLPAGPTSNSFTSQRLRMHYVDWGNREAPPLILQHGGRDHCRSWDWVAEELRRDWHVIAADLRGHGDSAWSPDGDYTMNAYVYDFAQLIHTLGHDQVTIVAHSLGGNIATRFTGLYTDKVRKLVNIEGLGPSPQVLAERNKGGYGARLREWIGDKRAAAARIPRRYATLQAAFERMREENSFLTDDQARHLTVHGMNRNEDGTWSWKFDNYLNVWPVDYTPQTVIEELWATIECPMLLFYGAKSFASNPERDGRANHFKTAQFDRFMADLKAFL
jgi:pimeloyl-ACP methyl ester carboxylesterase